MGVYTYSTDRIRKQAEKQSKESEESNLLDAVVTIHSRLTGVTSLEMRRWVYETSLLEMNHVLKKCGLPHTQMNGTHIDIKGLMARVSEMTEDEEKSNSFIQMLNSRVTFREHTSLTVIELALADFDLLAIPYSLNIKAAKVVAIQYKPVLEKSSGPLLAFIEIRRRLANEPGYRRHYVEMLKT